MAVPSDRTVVPALTAGVLSGLVGLAIGVGAEMHIVYAVAIGGGFAAIVIALRSALQRPSLFAFYGASIGIALVGANAMRFSESATFSDVALAATLPLALIAGAAARIRPPGWLVAGAALLAASVLLSELFPPGHPADEQLQVRNLVTGETEGESGFVLGARLIVAVALVPLVLALVVTSYRRVRVLTNLWLAGVAVSCAVAVLAGLTSVNLQETFTGGTYWFGEWYGASGRQSGLTVHPTLSGVSAAMALPLALVRIVDMRSALRYTPLAALYSLAVLVSGSRAALAALLFAFFAIFAWDARRRLGPVVAVGAILVAIGASNASFATIERVTGANAAAAASTEYSDQDRRTSLLAGWNDWLERPFTGRGFENVKGAHNTWLQLLSSGGIFALVGWALIIGGAVAGGFKHRHSLPSRDRGDTVGLAVGVGVLLLAGLSMNAVLDRLLYVPVGLLLAWVFAVQSERRKSNPPSWAP